MDDVVVLEATDHVQDRVALADVGEKLVAQAFAFRRAFDETGDIGKLDRRTDNLGRAVDFGERLEARILNLDDRRIRLDRTERIILGGGLLLFG